MFNVMIKTLLLKMTKNKTRKEDKSGEFSKFFRKASSREKKKVFLDVAKRASKEQLELIQSAQVAR